jgi:metaxin
MYYIQRRRKSAIAYLHNMHSGKLTSDVEIEFAVTRQALFCINMLAVKLGDKKYFFGDKWVSRDFLVMWFWFRLFRPSSFDALVFGYLAPLLKLPLPSDRLQQHLKSCPNLVRFVESIISIYLPLTDDGTFTPLFPFLSFPFNGCASVVCTGQDFTDSARAAKKISDPAPPAAENC